MPIESPHTHSLNRSTGGNIQHLCRSSLARAISESKQEEQKPAGDKKERPLDKWIEETRMKKEKSWILILLTMWVNKATHPTSEDMAGKLEDLTEAWLEWGYEKKLIKSEK